MRASTTNLIIAEGKNLTEAEWKNAPLYDAPLEMPLTLAITGANLTGSRPGIQDCAIALALKERNFYYFAVGDDVTHIGAFISGKPVRLRYRSGSLPRELHATFVKSLETAVLDLRPFETDNYTLHPPSEDERLEAQSDADEVSRSGWEDAIGKIVSPKK